MVAIQKVGVAGSMLFSMGVLLYVFAFPTMLKSQVKMQVTLKEGTEIRGFWEKLPQPLDFNIYVFNVTNPDDIKAGAKPIVQEVGPFHYDLYRDKENLVDRENEDTVEYSLRQVWYFNQEKSVMSEDAEIYMFHPIILAIILVAQKDRPSALGLVSKALDSIFKKPQSIFIKTNVKELFFYGLPVDCTVKDFAGTAICAELQEKQELFIYEDDLLFRYGFFAKANGSYLPERIKVSRGTKNHTNVGRFLSLGNRTKMNIWPGDPCNNFRGTDGTIFPPFLEKNKEVWAHFPDICRSIGAYYIEPGVVQGYKTLHYTANLGDPSTDQDVRCLCPEIESCMPKNIFDGYPCFKIPIKISLPHFYDSDPQYLEMVEGLNPDPKKHMMIFQFDALTGTPIRAYKKIQFNVLIGPISKIKLINSFPNAMFPLFWIEDGIELGDVVMKPLKLAYKLILIAHVVIWIMIISGIGLIIATTVLYFKEKQKQSITLKMNNKGQSDTATFQKKTIGIIKVDSILPNID